jgi:hypothetical protein
MTAYSYLWLLRNADILSLFIGMIIAAVVIVAFVGLMKRINRIGV